MSRKPGQTHVTSLTVDEAARFRAIVPATAKLAGLTRAQIAELLVRRRKQGRAYTRRPLLDETAVASAFAKREPLRAPLARDIYAVVAEEVFPKSTELPDDIEAARTADEIKAVKRAKVRWSLDLETRMLLGEETPQTRKDAIQSVDESIRELSVAEKLAQENDLEDEVIAAVAETMHALQKARSTLLCAPGSPSAEARSRATVQRWNRLQKSRAQARAMLWDLFITAEWLRDDRSREPLESDRKKSRRSEPLNCLTIY